MLCLLYGREMEKSNITFADTLIEIVKSKDEPTNHNAGGVVGAQGTVLCVNWHKKSSDPLCENSDPLSGEKRPPLEKKRPPLTEKTTPGGRSISKLGLLHMKSPSNHEPPNRVAVFFVNLHPACCRADISI